MKRTLKILLLSVLVLLVIASTNISIAASPTGVMKLEQIDSSTKYKVGDTVTVKLSLTSVTESAGPNIVLGQLEYDEDTLEYVAIDNLNSWGKAMYESTTKKFTLDREAMMSSGDILQIRFKLKAIPSNGKTKISIKGIDCSDEDNAIEINQTNEVSINAIIEEKSGNNGDKPGNTTTGTNTVEDTNTVTNTITGTNTVKDTNVVNNVPNTNTTNNGPVKENTQSGGRLPQTGATLGMFVAIVCVIGITIFAYIKYRNIDIE